MKCPSCNQRKGKRSCPALGKEICAQCCGEKRVIEIPCPKDCSFLGAGIEHEWNRVYGGLFDSIADVRQRSQLLTELETKLPLIKQIEYFLAEFAVEVRSLNDQDLQAVLELLLENFKTESKGIIYEHHSSNPFIQSFARAVTGKIEELRESARKERYNISASHIVSALSFLVLLVRHFRETSPDPRGYLKFVLRQYPEARSASRKDGREGGGIILAGR